MSGSVKSQWRVDLLGVRGSMAVTRPEFQKYGGDTVCIRVQVGGTILFLDAGTGIMYGEAGVENHILIGHPHLDHLIGLCKWKAFGDPGRQFHIFVPASDAKSAGGIVDGIIGPPYWPIHLEQLPAKIVYHPVTEAFRIGDVKVEVLSGNHPGGVIHYKLSDGEKTLVYAVDSELTPKAAEELAQFAKGCNLLICDGQLTDGDLEQKRGWGHSTMSESAKVGAECGADRTVLVHFDPSADDMQLETLEQQVRKFYPNCTFGKQGETILL